MTMQISCPPGFGIAVFHHSVTGVAHSMSTSLGISNPGLTAAQAASRLSSSFAAALANNGARLANTGRYLGLTFSFVLPNGDVHIEEVVESVVGTQGSAACPPQCALLVDKRTGLAGKSNRGRFFFPSCYLIEGEVDDAGIISGAVIAGHLATLEAWHAELIVDETVPYLLHQFGTYINGDGETVTVAERAPTPITAFIPSAKIATQRNRLR